MARFVTGERRSSNNIIRRFQDLLTILIRQNTGSIRVLPIQGLAKSKNLDLM